MDISVIIATYNRSTRLKQALESFEKIIVAPGVTWELMIFDNNSTDNTKEVCREFQKRNLLILRYFIERRQGKAYALNVGIREARGKIIVFSDDDVIVDPFWLKNISEEFENDSSLGGIGGRVELFDETDQPVTIRTSKERILFTSPRQLVNPPIIGVNMAFRKSVFDKVKGMDPSFGPGSRIGSNIDAEFIYRVHKKGFKMVYSPDVLVYHNHGRKSEKVIDTLNKKYLIGRGAFYCKYVLRGDLNIFLMASREIYGICKGIVKDILHGNPVNKKITMIGALMTGVVYQLTDFRRCIDK